MVVDAFCPDCREDLSETVEEAEFKPTLADMQEAVEPVRIVGGAFVIAVGAVCSILTLLGGAVRREWEVAATGAGGLLVCAYWFYRMRRQLVIRSSVTGRGRDPQDSEQYE